MYYQAIAALAIMAFTAAPVYPAELPTEADYHARCTCVIGRHHITAVGLFEDVTRQCSRLAASYRRKPMDFEIGKCDPALPDRYRRAYDDRPL